MSHRVLLLGGHGKVSLFLTPKLLSRSWQVTSIIRNPDHEGEIRAKGRGQPGQLDVLTRSLDDITSEKHAQSLIDEARPDTVVWLAGAGGKGGASRTYAVDRDAAKYFIAASAHTPSIKKFLMVSWIGSRRKRAPWWTDEDEKANEKIWKEVLPDYAKAKLDADEYLVSLAAQRGEDFQAITLRPGTLKDDEPTGKIQFGKTPARGGVTREDVADVAARLLESDEARGYYDLLNGDEDISGAIQKAIRERVNAIEGENVGEIVNKYSL